MSKKKNKKKETLLAETVKMQKQQAMNLVAQSNVNDQLLKEVIGIKEEMDKTSKKDRSQIQRYGKTYRRSQQESPY